MVTYKISIEDMKCNKCAMKIKQVLEAEDDETVVSANVSRKEIIIDTNMSVADIYEIIEEAGYTPGDLDVM